MSDADLYAITVHVYDGKNTLRNVADRDALRNTVDVEYQLVLQLQRQKMVVNFYGGVNCDTETEQICKLHWTSA